MHVWQIGKPLKAMAECQSSSSFSLLIYWLKALYWDEVSERETRLQISLPLVPSSLKNTWFPWKYPLVIEMLIKLHMNWRFIDFRRFPFLLHRSMVRSLFWPSVRGRIEKKEIFKLTPVFTGWRSTWDSSIIIAASRERRSMIIF